MACVEKGPEIRVVCQVLISRIILWQGHLLDLELVRHTGNVRSFFSFVGLYFTPYRGLREEIFFFTDYESPVDSGRKPFALILSESVTRHTERQTGLSNLQFLKKVQLKWFFFDPCSKPTSYRALLFFFSSST